MALMYCLPAMLSIISHVVIHRTRAHTRMYICCSSSPYASFFSLCACVFVSVCGSVDEHFYQCYRITHIHHRLNMHLIMTFYSNGTYIVMMMIVCSVYYISKAHITYTCDAYTLIYIHNRFSSIN